MSERPAPPRVLSKTQRILRARRRNKFRENAHANADSPGSLLADPDYHQARACGWDVARRDRYFRQPEPPTRSHCKANPYYDPAERYPVPSHACASWRWWKALDKDQQDDLYELSIHGREGEEGDGGYVTVNPRLLADDDPRSVNEWGR